MDKRTAFMIAVLVAVLAWVLFYGCGCAATFNQDTGEVWMDPTAPAPTVDESLLPPMVEWYILTKGRDHDCTTDHR